MVAGARIDSSGNIVFVQFPLHGCSRKCKSAADLESFAQIFLRSRLENKFTISTGLMVWAITLARAMPDTLRACLASCNLMRMDSLVMNLMYVLYSGNYEPSIVSNS